MAITTNCTTASRTAAPFRPSRTMKRPSNRISPCWPLSSFYSVGAGAGGSGNLPSRCPGSCSMYFRGSPGLCSPRFINICTLWVRRTSTTNASIPCSGQMEKGCETSWKPSTWTSSSSSRSRRSTSTSLDPSCVVHGRVKPWAGRRRCDGGYTNTTMVGTELR